MTRRLGGEATEKTRGEDDADGHTTREHEGEVSTLGVEGRAQAATNSGADISFHQLHRKCHTPIQLKKWCPHCHLELHAADIVKGYESSKGRMLVVEEEDVEKVRPESTHTSHMRRL
jgi:non-homologous end joining protein Ku